MAPLRDAVRFVDGDERGFAFSEHLREAGDAEALGGDEEEVESAFEIGAGGFAQVFARQAGVDAGNAEVEVGEFMGLVVHEGDQGGDDQRGAVFSGGPPGKRGQLVAEAFARAGGHDEKHVAAGGGGFADGLLVRAEVAVAEGLMKELAEIWPQVWEFGFREAQVRGGGH